ncbi:MAG: hypothetical protein WBW33_36670 [Bryobacteraceae bacterium]
MTVRTIEDRLREEYFDLLPEIRRVAEHLEAEVRYHVLPVSDRLDRFEKLVVSSRVKECESALDSLRRRGYRQEGATFDPDRAGEYTLTSLKDLAGVRVLAFPSRRREETDAALRSVFPSWTADPVLGEGGERLAFKYWGYCPTSRIIRGEYQILSVLTGLFWEIEHSAIYKPSLELRGVGRALGMPARTKAILDAFSAFEEEFERVVSQQAG